MGNTNAGSEGTTMETNETSVTNTDKGTFPWTDCSIFGFKSGITNTCSSDKELIAGLCYTKPRPGFNCSGLICNYGTLRYEVGTIPDSCPSGYENRLGTCWPICPSGFKDSPVTCEKNRINMSPTVLSCPVNTVNKDSLCYPQCSEGYTRDINNPRICTTVCPNNTKSDGNNGCLRNVIDRKTSGKCNEGFILENGLCYTKPLNGYKCVDKLCTKDNKIKQEGNPPTRCQGDRININNSCYLPCPSGYERKQSDLNYCVLQCPPGYINTINGCELLKKN